MLDGVISLMPSPILGGNDMAWKAGMFGKVKLSGNVKAVIDRVQEWYAEDYPTRSVSYDRYLTELTGYALPVVQNLWEREGRYADAHELAVIDTAWSSLNDPARSLARYDFADYVADRMSQQQFEQILLKARAWFVDEYK